MEAGAVSSTMKDLLYDPPTSGGLLMALPMEEAADCLRELRIVAPDAACIGRVTERAENWIVLE